MANFPLLFCFSFFFDWCDLVACYTSVLEGRCCYGSCSYGALIALGLFHSIRRFTEFPSLPPSVWPAHQESQKEDQGGYFQVYDSVPGPQPEDAGAVQPCKYKYKSEIISTTTNIIKFSIIIQWLSYTVLLFCFLQNKSSSCLCMDCVISH